MRTYKRSSHTSEKPKKRMGKKGVYALAVSASVVLIAVALTLSLTFGLRKTDVPVDDGTHVDVPPVNNPPALTFGSPLSECTVKKAAAIDKLVYNETLKQWRTHNGVDFEAVADSDVYSVADGTVSKVENTILEGVVVTVTHAEGYVSIYKGLDSASVESGDTVTKGSVIGKVGTMMCEHLQGTHLHLEMKKNGAYVSATDYIDTGAEK